MLLNSKIRTEIRKKVISFITADSQILTNYTEKKHSVAEMLTYVISKSDVLHRRLQNTLAPEVRVKTKLSILYLHPNCIEVLGTNRDTI